MTARPAMATSYRPARVTGALCAATVLALTVAGCGGTSAGTAASSTAGSADSPGCGTVPAASFKGSGGLVKALGGQYTAAYSGYSGTVQASRWATWKPKKTSGLTVGISESQLSNPYQTLINTSLQKYLKSYGFAAGEAQAAGTRSSRPIAPWVRLSFPAAMLRRPAA